MLYFNSYDCSYCCHSELAPPIFSVDFGSKLGLVERVAARLHTEREELAHDMDNFYAAILQWSLNEPDIIGPIQQTAACVDKCSTALKLLVRHVMQCNTDYV